VVRVNRAFNVTQPVAAIPGQMWFYDPSIQEPQYNVTKANQLLDEAGLKRGADGTRFTLRLAVTNAYPELVKEGELIRDFLREVGITVTLVVQEDAAWQDLVWTRWDFDMSMNNFISGPDPVILITYWTGRGIGHFAFSNTPGYNNSDVNNLLYQSLQESDTAKRGDLIKRAMKMTVDDLPAYWILERPYVNALNLDFSDEFQPGIWEAGGGFNMQRFERVYWTKATITSTQTAVQPPQPTIPEWVYLTAAIVMVGVIAVVSYAVRARRKPKAG